jgi:diguanylate cyclase (GGDEF)-like protein
MSAAAFVLAINLFVAAMFATSFGVVAAYARSSVAARWLSAAYALGIVTACLEFSLPFQIDHRPVSFAIFTAFLLSMAGCVIGLAYHFRIDRPWRLLGTLVIGSMLVNLTILGMPRESLLRGMLYQLPYSLVQSVAVIVLLKTKRWRPLDIALLVLFVLSVLHFPIKPLMAAVFGSGAVPQAYLASNYAAYSQALGAVMLISNGLLMLLVILRDTMADMATRSETDTLSGLFNRRGFETHCDKALDHALRSGLSTVMVTADLDHFKQINDTFGHAAGDAVIARFAEALTDNAGDNAKIGRLGGEEFAVLLSGANLSAGRLYAEAVRTAFRHADFSQYGLHEPVTASFGIAPLTQGDTLSDLLRRADAALYRSKTGGRDRVAVAMPEVFAPDSIVGEPVATASR